MSYEPTEWKSGDVISSAKLNKMEQGIAAGGTGGGGFLLCNATLENDEEWWLDKTWQEVRDAADTGVVVCKAQEYEDWFSYTPLGCIGIEDELYKIIWGDGSGMLGEMRTTSSNGYPNTSSPGPAPH